MESLNDILITIFILALLGLGGLFTMLMFRDDQEDKTSGTKVWGQSRNRGKSKSSKKNRRWNFIRKGQRKKGGMKKN